MFCVAADEIVTSARALTAKTAQAVAPQNPASARDGAQNFFFIGESPSTTDANFMECRRRRQRGFSGR